MTPLAKSPPKSSSIFEPLLAFFQVFETDLCCRGDGAGGDPHRVDASIGVLVDFDVGFLLPGLEVSSCVEQIEHLLVVKLKNKKVINN